MLLKEKLRTFFDREVHSAVALLKYLLLFTDICSTSDSN